MSNYNLNKVEDTFKYLVNECDVEEDDLESIKQQLKTQNEKIEKLVECIKYYRDETTDIIAVRAKRVLEEIKEQGNEVKSIYKCP